MADWGGAQWVLITIMAYYLILPPLARAVAEPREGRRPDKPLADWMGAYLARLTGCGFLVLLLRWGGFF